MNLEAKENFIEAVAMFVDHEIKKRMEPLEKKIVELEALPKLRYCGTWSDDKTYAEGNFVTHGGSVWHCNAKSTARMPGNSDDWVLAVKHGRDARER